MLKVGSKVSEQIKNLLIQDKEGKQIKFNELFKEKTGIIIFVRHFNCYLCRDQMEAINKNISKIENAQTKLSIIGCGDYKRIQSLCNELQIKSDNVYTDNQREVYKSLGLIEVQGLKEIGGKGEKAEDLRQGIYGTLSGFAWSFYKMMRVGKQGNPYQLGGTYIIGSQDDVLFSHVDQSGNDIVSVNQLINLSSQFQ